MVYTGVQPVQWERDQLKLLDQRILPQTETWLFYDNVRDAAQAITDMVVRGAPAIGITAAYAVVLAARAHYKQSGDNWQASIKDDLAMLADARPTAINLQWAIDTLQVQFSDISGDPEPALLKLAQQIHAEDIAACQLMGKMGSEFLPENCSVLTHCNAGALATGGYGTALGVIRAGVEAGKITQVFADETRPWLQGARLTAWELLQDKIPVDLLADGAASYLMSQGKVDWVVVGSDRVAANGDVANKIGTYNLAVAAKYHGVKFMVVAPTSTVDMQVASGKDIPIESRDADEIHKVGGQIIAAEGAGAWNPVFDVTPAELVDVFVSEKAAIEQPNQDKILAMMEK